MPNNRWIPVTAWLLLCAGALGIPAATTNAPQASSPFTIAKWDTEDGLPQNSVVAMTQTRDGYLWLGTLNGLARFDGIRFAVFDESNTPGLDSSRIVHLFEDSRANLWIGTGNAGVALVAAGKVTSLDIGRGTPEGRLAAACEDSSGTIWLYTADGQLCPYRNGKVGVWNVGASNCRALISEKNGSVWVGMDQGLFALGTNSDPNSTALLVGQEMRVGKLDYLLASQRGGHWRLVDGHIQKWSGNQLERDFGIYPWRSGTPVSAACEDRQGNLIVGTLGDGVYWFEADGNSMRLSSGEGLSHNTILSLCVDREGSLWVGTDGGGLNRVKRQVFEVLDGTSGMTIQSVCADSQGGVWIGSFGGGLYRWSDGLLRREGAEQGLTNLFVRAVFMDRDQRLWVGAEGVGLLKSQNGLFRQEVINRYVAAIHQDRAGQLWVGTQGGLLCWDERNWKVFTARDGLSSDDITAIADDPGGNLWIGTRGGGLNRLRDRQFTAYRKNEKDGIPSDNISSLLVDEDGTLWIGTSGGLARFRNGKWTRYTAHDGLVSNSIGYLAEDGRGYLWIGSNLGLMRVKKRDLDDFEQRATGPILVRTFGKADGLPTRECTFGSQPAACRTADGRLWFPTIKGLVSVDPGQLNSNTNVPPVRLESLLVEGREQFTNGLRAALPQSVAIPPGKGRLELQFTCLNLAAPDKARFKYWLEDYDTVPTETTGNVRPGIARYPKLPPGSYHFHVTACNEDGLWNPTGATLAIIVLPPFWQQWWFRAAVLVALLGTIIAVVHYLSTQRLQRQLASLRQHEALEQERARIARDIHDQLGASLTQVSLLGELVESDKNVPDEVEAHARQISQTARDTTRVLDEIVWTVNPSNDTLDGLVTYVCKYAQEYLAVAGLRYRLDVPAQLPGTAIPPEVRHNVFLAAKEAVTNVVRHAQASEARIRLRVESTAFTLEIEDNGRGMADLDEKAAQSRNGLRNMRKRMEDVGGTFSMGPGAEGGTRVRLTAPIRQPGK